MSEEKLHLIRSRTEDKVYFSGNRMIPNWSDKLISRFGSYEIAKEIAEENNGQPVTFVEEPEKVTVSPNEAQAIESLLNADTYADVYDPFQYLFTSRYKKDIKRLIKAIKNGYTVAKEKKYIVKVPHTDDSYFYKVDDEYCNAGDSYYLEGITDKKWFTDAEIEHYGLGDCEKVWCDSDDD